MNNNLISFNPCQDVFLYFDSSLKNCVDIDIKDGVDTVVFDGGNSKVNINLRNVNKQFPDVKTIVINEDVIEINISNFMFPNVRNVVSHSQYFYSGRYLISSVYFSDVLRNVFCIRPGEDIEGITADTIEDYAFEGCMETDGFFGGTMYHEFSEKAFAGSAFLNLPPHNGLIVKDGIIFAVDDDATEISIDEFTDAPHKYTGFYSMPVDLDLKHVKKMTLHHLNHAESMTVFPETVVIADESDATRRRRNYCGVLNDKRIKNFEVKPDSQSFKVIDGILYSKDGRYLLKCPRGKTGHVTIPKGTEIIAANAFKHCHIDSVSFPSTLIQLENDAFASSTVKKIDFGIGIKAIGWFSFMNCRELKSIVIPHQMEVIEKYAFYESGVESVSFEGEEPIPGTAVLLPSDKDNLCCVDEGAFRRCDIEKVIVSDRVHLQQNSFGNIKELTTDKYDDSIIDTVFKNSVEAVVKITIGDRMTVLPYAYAFAMHGDETLLHKACRGYFANGSAEMKSQIDSSFMLGNNDDAREIMAEKMYMMDNSNDAAKTFLQQHSMKIVKYVCDRNSSATKKERILTNYTRLDMLSDDTLHYVLEYANDNNMPILAAEVLDRINKNEAKNNNPEHTFRI